MSNTISFLINMGETKPGQGACVVFLEELYERDEEE